MTERDKIIMTINLFNTILEYQGEIAYLNSELEKRTEDNVRNGIKARLIWLYETMPKLEKEVIVLAYAWIKYFEERSTSKKKEESD